MATTQNFLLIQLKNNNDSSRAQESKSKVDRSFYDAQQEDKGVSPSTACYGKQKVKLGEINTSIETTRRLKKLELNWLRMQTRPDWESDEQGSGEQRSKDALFTACVTVPGKSRGPNIYLMNEGK